MLTNFSVLKSKGLFLDTSFILDIFSDSQNPKLSPDIKDRIESCKAILEKVNFINKSPSFPKKENEEKKKNKIPLFISTITIAELTHINEQSALEAQAKLMQAADVTYVNFNYATASLIASKTMLNTNFLKQIRSDLQNHGVANARNWIKDDIKILACANFVKNQISAVLTCDEGFYKISKIFELENLCVLPQKLPRNLLSGIVV
jgi:predicted nucleic acid-binding protein